MMMEVQQGNLAGDNPSELDDEDRFFDETIPPAQPEAAGEPAAPEEEREQEEPRITRKNDPREYVVLELRKDDDGEYLSVVARVVARNGVNAIRKAFREHIKDDELHQFVTVPGTQFKPIPVQHTKREVGSVSIGA